MPSDLAKKKAAKKKEAAKARQRPRKGHEENGDAVTEPQVAEEKNEEANGRETTGELRERWVPGMVATTYGCPSWSQRPDAGGTGGCIWCHETFHDEPNQ